MLVTLDNLNQVFVSNIKSIFGAQGEAWLADLPGIIRELAGQWDFEFIKPVETLSYHFVGVVRIRQSGQIGILKIATDSSRIHREAVWLQLVRQGVPTVYASSTQYHAYLMQALEPGTSLKPIVQSGQDDEATKIICRVIRAIQSQEIVNNTSISFGHLSELIHDLSVLKGYYPDGLLSKAVTLFTDLTQDHSNDVLLHGDLHHDNILSCTEGWKAIDPHGYMGDRVAEVGAMIRNPFDDFPTYRSLQAIIERRLHLMADELSFDYQRVRAWAFCITVLSDAWTIQDHPGATEANLDIHVVKAIDHARS